MSTTKGLILEVSVRPYGTELEDDHTAGATTLAVTDVSDFQEDDGEILVENAIYAYSALDRDALTMAIDPPLAADFDAGWKVYVWPRQDEKWAMVEVNGEAEPISALVPYDLYDRVDDGIRDPEEQEAVVLEMQGGDWTVVNVQGQEPVVYSRYLDTPIPDVGPDGNPPQPVANLSLVGGIGALFASWDPVVNNDPVRYNVHLGTADAFAPDETNLVATTDGSTFTIRTLPNGDPLAYGTTYFVRVVSLDLDGPADPSATASAQMMQVTGPDVAANYVYAGNVLAQQVAGGTFLSDLLLSGSIKTAVDGARVTLGATGIKVFDSLGAERTSLNSDGTSSFRGSVEATDLTVTGDAALRGETEISKGGSVNLAAGTSSSPSLPSATSDWHSLALTGTPEWVETAGYVARGVQWDAANSRWLVSMYSSEFSASYVLAYSAAGAYVVEVDDYSHGGSDAANSVIFGGTTYWLYGFGGSWYLQWFGTNSGFTTYAGVNTAGQRPALGTDGTYLYVAEINSANNKVRISKYDPAAAAGANLVPNPSFETNTTGWANEINAALARSTAQAYAGSASLALTSTVAGYMLARTPTGTAGIPVSPSTRYTLQMQSRAATVARDMYLGYAWYDSSGAIIGTSAVVSGVYNTTSGWTQRAHTTTSPANAAYLSVRVGVATTAAGEVHYFDDVQVYLPAGLQKVSHVESSDAIYTSANYSGVKSVQVGNFDLGAARYIVAVDSPTSANRLHRAYNSTGTVVTADGFRMPDAGVVGATWDGSKFWSLSNDLVLYRHEAKNTTGQADETWYASFTWRNAALDYETTQSPQRSFTMRSRSRVVVTTPEIPNDPADATDPDAIGVYLGKTGTPPSRLAMWLQGESATNTLTITGPVWTGSNPPATNGFPPSTTGRIASTTGGFEVTGNGGGAWPRIQPTGAIEMYAGDTAPAGWLLCDGGTFSSNDYPVLATVVGAKFGAVVGTTYTLPNFTGKMPRGATPGTSGGAATHTIGTANLPPHAHTIAHTHDMTHDHTNATVAMRSAAGGSSAPVRGNATADGSASVNIPQFAGNTGGSSAANSGNGPGTTTPVDHMNPWLGVNFIIKHD